MDVYIYTPRAKREGVAGKYGCGWKMREWKKVEGEGATIAATIPG